MCSPVQALRRVTASIGSALGMVLSPVAVNPKVMYLYMGLAATMIAAAPAFWVSFGNYDKIDDELNETGLI
ncbi:oligopeptide transporter [Penicillium vulpinum]|uniref:oligopeptide transporter n=1 Tax=Penicillium vulpinum TaxID=29845 RepID=UPI0025495E73|nr:oligopeptide transporter [Penicillium vulpinum]KAJ5972816.1 oligopeptide transporter [Penicillium vulpinum]